MTEQNATHNARKGGGQELKVPNAETRAAMAEADDIVKAGRARFATVGEMLADLEETGRS